MSARHRSREKAVQILYLWDMRDEPAEAAMEAFYGSLTAEEGTPADRDAFADELVTGVTREITTIDREIERGSENWKLGRMAAVDRNILRLAVYEMAYGGVAPAIVIDEALLLAKRFSGETSASFINGVLDAVKRNLERPDQPAP